VEKKYYFSVWRRDTKVWEGLAATKYEAVERACGDYNRQELTAKRKK
jgi:uncharacterized protein YbdZ (MbtH family)